MLGGLSGAQTSAGNALGRRRILTTQRRGLALVLVPTCPAGALRRT
jgi:hypothetical protein